MQKAGSIPERRVYRLPKLREWLKTKAAVPAPDAERFELHLAAHEWSLANPLDINHRDDFSCLSRIDVSPYEHQVDNAIQFFRCLLPAGMIADDVGLGKTVTAGLIARELLDRGRVESLLVVCPKSIMEQWQEELRTKFNIAATFAVGANFYNCLKQHSFCITTYQTARNYIAAIKERQFDLIILDEAHALRNLYGAQKPPKTAQVFRSLMADGKVRFCIMLTATPIQNRLWDIYSQFEVLKAPQPNPLGPPDEFSRRFIADREARRLRPGMEQEFRRRLSQALNRTRRKDTNLLFPEREVKDTRLVPLPEERIYIDRALKVILQFPRLVQYTYARSLMSSPWALAASFQKKAESDVSLSPALKAQLLELAKAGRAISESAKTRAVVEHVKASVKNGRAERIIVFTMRLETLRFLAEALERAGFASQIAVMQGGQAQANARAKEDFLAEPPLRPILLTTDVGGVGLNLQKANVVINYDLPWNPMIIEQRIGRVQRLGQKAKWVIVHNLVLKDTIEDHVVLRLMEKLNLFHQAIGEMEELLELCGYDGDNRSLEQVIMDLVRKAVEKKDISEDLQRMEESRRKAEAKMRDMRKATEEALGTIRAADHGRRLTGLKRITPRFDLRSLVKRSLSSIGVPVREMADGRLLARSSGGEIEYVFDPDDTALAAKAGHQVRLVMPGTKTFDRITRQIREGSSIYVLDARKQGLEKVENNLRQRLMGLGMTLEKLRVTRTETRYALRSWLLVRVTVATDRYETIIEVPVVNSEDGVSGFLEFPYLKEVGDSGRFSPVDSSELAGTGFELDQSVVRKLVEEDESVNAFCTFYEGRFQDDLQRLAAYVREKYPGVRNTDAESLVRDIARRDGSIKTALQSLELQFIPQVQIEPLGICGVAYELAQIQAYVRNRSQKEANPITIEAVPLSGVLVSDLSMAGREPSAVGEGWACPGGHIVAASEFQCCVYEECTVGMCKSCLAQGLQEPTLKACQDCNELVCVKHRQDCSRCGNTFCLAHLYKVEGHTGLYCAECSVELLDGTRILVDEARVSVVTGRVGSVAQMYCSPVSGRWAYPDEMAECEVSGRWVLPDELELCAVTGRKVARDLLEQSAVSGRFAQREYIQLSDWTGRPFIRGEEVTCEETGATLLPDEVDVCSITGRRVRKDLLEIDFLSGKPVLKEIMEPSAVSGRLTLPDNLMVSSHSGRKGLPDECAVCEACGQRVLIDELMVCPETGKRATKDHFQKCAFTGDLVLPDGLSVCEVTGKVVRRSLLRLCPETGKRAIAHLFEKCEATGIDVLPEGLAVSAVSGMRVRRSLLVSCEETDRLALPHELEVCTVTKRRVHPELIVRCPDTGLSLLRSAGVRCEETGVVVHPSAVAQCSATGRTVRLSLLVTDDLTGKPVLQRLTSICELTGVRTISENLGTSSVSHRRVLRERLVACAESGRYALPEELRPCEKTGKIVHPDLLFTCPETEMTLLRRLGETCEATGDICAPEGLGTCHITGQRVRRSLLATDEITGYTVQKKFLHTCSVTGVRTVRDNLTRSQVSGKLVLTDLLVQCEVSGAPALPEELKTCAATQKRVLPRLLARCQDTNQDVLADLLETCDITGKRVLGSRLVVCRRSGTKVLKQLAGYSELSGEAGLAELLQQCASTGRRLFPDESVVLSDGRCVGRDRLFCCPGCGKNVDIGETFRCRTCNQFFCKDDGENSQCDYCRALIDHRKGESLSEDATKVLQRQYPWLRQGFYLLSHSLVFVLVRGGSVLNRKSSLAVFRREGDALHTSLGQTPLYYRALK